MKGPLDQRQQPIPIEKLSDFLLWKEKEFVEKYYGVRYHREMENYASIEGKDKSGLPIVAIINQDLMNWDAKVSYPWMMVISIEYGQGNNGMPDQNTSDLFNQIEDDLLGQLANSNNYLNLGRKTYNNTRTIYFACKEFKFISKQANMLLPRYVQKVKLSYDIYKDKYWRTMNQFNQRAF